MKETSRRNVTRGLTLEAELVRILDAFSAEGIDVAVLKGVLQQRMIHSHLGTRWIADNDLLVRKQDVQGAASAIRRLGYKSDSTWSLANRLEHNHEYPFVRCTDRGAPLVIDLHWDVLDPRLYPIPQDLVWLNMRRTVLRGRPVWVPSVPFGLLIASYQGLTHLTDSSRRISELALWWKLVSEDERAQVITLARDIGGSELLNLPLQIAWHRGDLAEEPGGALTTRTLASWINRQIDKSGRVDGFLMLSARTVPAGLRGAMTYICSRLFVSDDEVAQSSGAHSKWAKLLGPRAGRIVNTLFPTP